MDGTAILSKLSTANNRIYVGNLGSVNTTMLNGKFSVHGRIIVILQKGSTFCFIEYDNPQSAQLAIEFENQSHFCGLKIVVRQAMSKPKPHKGSCKAAFDENNDRNGSGNSGNQNSMCKFVQVSSARCLFT